MTRISSQHLTLVVSGIELLYELFGKLDKALLQRALRKEVPIPHVTRVPSWEDTERFIEVNPDFLSTEQVQSWWDSRDTTQSRVRLMITLARHLRRTEGGDIYIFGREIRRNADVLPLVMSVADDIKMVLDDPTLSKERRTEMILEILKEASQ